MILLMSAADVAADRDGWLKRRHGMLTASDFPALLGIAPKRWKIATPYSLFEAKSAPEPGPDEDGEYLALGRFMETWVADRFAARHPELRITEAGLYADDDRPWLGCTFDRLAYEGGGELLLAPVQCKTAPWPDPEKWGPPGSQAIPREYRAQALIELHIARADWIWVPVYFHDRRRVVTYGIPLDDVARADIAWMLARADDFRDRLATGRAPAITAGPADTEALKRRFGGQPEKRKVTVPWGLARRYRRAVHAVGRAEERRDLAANLIRVRLGTANQAVDPAGVKVCTRSVYEQTRLDVGELRERRPDVAAQFEKVTPVDKMIPARKAWQ